MPRCASCSKPFKCTCDASKPKLLGATSEGCALEKKPGAVWVHVTDDKGVDVKDIEVSADGAPKPTGRDGLAMFDSLSEGSHSVALSALSVDALKLYEQPEILPPRKVPVAPGEISYVAYELANKPSLKVKVVEKGGAKLFGAATVKADGPEPVTKPSEALSGVADMGRVKAGEYKITATLKADDEKTHATTIDFAGGKHVAAKLGVGDQHEAIVEVEPLNLVKPKVEMEHKLVVLDRQINSHQTVDDKKQGELLPDPTYILVCATQSNPDHPLAKGARLSTTGTGTVAFFFDEECKKPCDGKLEAAQLIGTNPTKLWLRGTAAGKFDLKFDFDDPADRFVKVDATLPKDQSEMGVVALVMEVYRFDKGDIDAQGPFDPDQDPVAGYHTALTNNRLEQKTKLTPAQQIAQGRFLHAQNADKNHARAKLVLKKLDAAHLPAGVDAYDILLHNTGLNALGIHSLEDPHGVGVEVTDGVGAKVSALKSADVTLWIEGKDACLKLRDAALSLGFGRAAGGLPNAPKLNGDCARFTTVKIEEVKLDYTQDAKADKAWDEANRRYYININQKALDAGRKIHLSVRLSAKIEGVPIHFMLAPDENNCKIANWGIDFPAAGRHFNVNAAGVVAAVAPIKWKDVNPAFKQIDKPDRQRLLHVRAETDKQGAARKEVSLSRFGADKFHPAAYIEQDPEQSKFVHGHATLDKKQYKPVIGAVTPIQIWRKLYYQVTEPAATPLPVSNGFRDTQRAVFVESERTATVTYTDDTFKVNPSRPGWQYRLGGGPADKFCIGDHNVDAAMKPFVVATAADSPKLHFMVCDEQFDADGVTTDAVTLVFADANPVDQAFTVGGDADGFSIFSPPLQGGDLVAAGGTWKVESIQTALIGGKEKSRKVTHSGALPSSCVDLDSARDAVSKARVRPPTACLGAAGGCPCNGKPTTFKIDAKHVVTLTFELQAATGPWGGWAPDGADGVVAVQRATYPDGSARPDNIVQDTLGHELGHKFGMIRHTREATWPDHPRYYQMRGGSGTHCSENAVWAGDGSALDPSAANSLDAAGKAGGKWTDTATTCVLYHSATAHKRNWCKHCKLDFSFSDLSRFS